MPRRRKPEPETVPELIARLRALDVYKTGNSLACKTADALERLLAENALLKERPEGSD